MAIGWYLLKGENSILGGTEDDSSSFISDSFSEILGSTFAKDVDLYNYDLSQRTSIKAVIQNVVQDTRLKSFSRQALVPIGSCKAGMYIKYKGRFWLISNIVDDNMMYEKALLSICNYYLTWVNDKGDIVQRWANITSASQYNNGETFTDHYRTGTDQLMILLPDDDECVLLDSGKRFVIDQRCKVYEKGYDGNVSVDTGKPLSVYRLTRTDSVLYDYQDSGNYQCMVYQDEQKPDDGYYVINGKGYWLCEKPIVQNNETPILSCDIRCESAEIYDGLEAGEFIAEYYDTNGNIVGVPPMWEINAEFVEELRVQYVENSILIFCDNPKLIGKSFILSLGGYGYAKKSIEIKIKAFL